LGPLGSRAWLTAVVWLIIPAIDQRLLFAGLDPSSALLTEHAPDVTIIVPVRDESSNIAACLHSLLRQRYPASRLVVLVVDDESTDDTALIVQALAEVNAHLQLLHSPALPRGTTG